MTVPPRLGDRGVRALGAAGGIASCLPMLAMLPAGFAGAIGAVGLEANTGLSQELAPVAKPLLLVSATLLAVGGLRCSRLAAGLALAGGALLYLSMYVWTRPDGTTAPALFYPGLALFLGTFLVGWIRPKIASCRPVLAGRNWRRLAIGTLLIGTAVVGGSLVVGFGSPSAADRQTADGHHSGAMSSMSTMNATPLPNQQRPFVSIAPGRFSWDAMLAGATRTYRYRVAMGPQARIRVRGLFPDGMVTLRIEDGAGRPVIDAMYWSENRPDGQLHRLRGRAGPWTVTVSLMQAGGGPFRVDLNG